MSKYKVYLITDAIGPLYFIDEEQSTSPTMMLSMSADSCRPRFLSDIIKTALIFDVSDYVHQLESSLLKLEAADIRAFLQQQNQPGSGIGARRRRPPDHALAALVLFKQLFFPDPKPSRGCCAPTQWQATATKMMVYKYNLAQETSGSTVNTMKQITYN